MKYLFVMNPGSRDGKSKKFFNTIFSLLNEAQINFAYKYTSNLNDAYDFAYEANCNQYDVIVAVGGDGTINRVMNGFFDDEGNKISKAKLGIIYTGTSPDICKEYNIPFRNIKKSIETLIKCNVNQVQVGKVELFINKDESLTDKPFERGANTTTRYFLAASNIGVGAMIARYANSGIRKKLGDTLGTFISLIRALFSYKKSDYTICTDGEKKVVENAFNICIGKSYYVASGIKVYNELTEDDSRFYNVIIKNLKFKNSLSLISSMYSGKEIVSNHNFSFSYLKEVEVYGNGLSPEVELDGDPAGFLPCSITVAKDKLSLIVTESNKI